MTLQAGLRKRHVPSRPGRRFGLTCLCLLALGTALSLAACDDGPAAGQPRFRALSIQPGDGITISDSIDDVTFDINSDRGIGTLEIERGGRPAKTLTVSLQLKGLEELQLAWGDTRVLAHVNSGSGEVREELSLKNAEATSIDSKNPYWMPVRIEAENPQIPLQSGSFAVTAPPAFLRAAPQRFSLKWVDFYR